MSARTREKSRELAAWLKAKGIERTTGQCPWGCGRALLNGGPALLAHLTRCLGGLRADRRTRPPAVLAGLLRSLRGAGFFVKLA